MKVLGCCVTRLTAPTGAGDFMTDHDTWRRRAVRSRLSLLRADLWPARIARGVVSAGLP